MNNTVKEPSPGILGKIERVCDKLPPPGVIFFILFVATAVLSALLSGLGVSLVNPASGETVSVQNFFTADGINWFLETMVENFSSFYPRGMVLILTMAVGLRLLQPRADAPGRGGVLQRGQAPGGGHAGGLCGL